MKKRLLSAALALAMLCSAVPVPVYADDLVGGGDGAVILTETTTGEETPASTEVTEATATPEPTEAPEATVTPEPEATQEPEATPEPTEATEATATPEPTEVPEATVTPVPTETPAPAGEPAPQTLGLAPNLLAANDGASTLAQERTKPVGEGTQEAPYQISTADDLFWFAGLVNGTLEGVEQNAAACAVLTTNITISEGRAWTPIGNSRGNQYTGTFDGAGFTIDNLKIDNGSAQFPGFVGCLGAGGKLQNLTMGASCSVTGYSPVGGLCSRNQGTIENCTNRGTVSGRGTVGGVCGSNVGTLTGCTNSGEVTGSGNNVGGVCGGNTGGTIQNCTNSGEVTGSGQYVGGVCGENMGGGTLTGCTNSGAVSGGETVGGVCGENIRGGTIQNCTNKAAVTGSETVGGLCGYNSSNITYCYSTGTVTSNGNNVGGVCGFNGSDGALTNCYWLDTAYSENGVGTDKGTVNNVYSKTDTAFSSGAVCWLLNRESADSPVWYQKLGTDTYPVLDSSHGTVYCIDEDLSFYSNDSNAKLDISGATVALSQERFTYNGTVQKPTVTVTLDGKTLTENTHYTVAYSGNCIDAGDYTVTVTGTCVCSGTVSEKHTIYPAEISIASATVQGKTYDGGTTATVESVEFTGLVNSESLTPGKDYTATATFADKNVGDSKQATVTVELKNGNYTFVQGGNTTTATAKIAPLAVALTWSETTSFTYDGSEHSVTAEVTNKVDGDTLNLTYAGNTEKNVGNYTATVTALDGADAANYTLDGVENLTQAWSIASASLAGAEVTLDESTFTYTGSEQKPTVTVKLGGKTLDAGTDYDVDFGGDSINADTYTVTVTGKGNYSGTATEKPTYTINPAPLTISGATLADKTYDGTTAATVTGVTFTEVQGSDALTLGNDYTATAKFDTADAGTGKTATVTVTLKNGNYTFADGSETTYTLTGQTIAKAAAAVAKDPAAVADLTYNGQDQALVTAGTATGGTMMYRLGENGDYTDAVPTGTDAGNYTVYYYVKGDANHNDTAPASEQVTFAKKAATVAVQLTPSNRIKVGDKLPDVELVYTGLVDGESITAGTVELDNMPTDSNTIGNYQLMVSQATQTEIETQGNNYSFTYTDVTLTILDETVEELPAEDEEHYRLEKSELTQVPAELEKAGYETVDDIQEAMYAVAVKALPGVTDENTEFHDVTLLFSKDGGKTWIKATEENFPANGITVTLPYPDGTNAADYDFVVTHMVTVTMNDLVVGAVETPAVTKTADGLRFTVKSLSPVAVSWRLTPKTESSTGSGESTSPAATPAPTATPAPDGTVYYTCPACGHHDWTATDTGYRCDTCGYVESLKQLAGYGNVKGVYEPKTTGSAAAGTATADVPQTGDTSNPALWLGLLLLSGLALGGITLYRRKKTQ